MFTVVLLSTCLFLVFASLSVFGGGQVFMPIFKWMWLFIAKNFNININETMINNAFTVSNSTPGIISTKFAFFTGYFISNGSWYGHLLTIVTYIFFVAPAILMMFYSMKYINKFNDSPILKRLIIILKPVVAGIVVSLALQLIISVIFPYLIFNDSINDYFQLNFSSQKVIFFSGWRLIVLYIYVPISVIISFILYRKKVSLFWLIIANILIVLIIFMPWL
ncbi:chromate transporter [Mycoplasmopsis anatis]|uniref:chromate transporter n=1 Tax=Mycoplasmopsis anatis TaxID=171279 RepID=UPI001C4DF5BB|nr:chromate transporter [Mycoplasmopsis anatis]MBW0594789.1 chromate transporter [Mycoplasmopsis anatis]MBW0595604.1 chromate transporter [Mycoplasmopsis anatis]MBW0598366.1 chromate transporter [Mycoplasmopsis anatis]MBW0599313.1 chromate transporter [Mycoplasmopsis anatis]MBW0601352.1 chromate transporter [Mycoplasmopsis anatis]